MERVTLQPRQVASLTPIQDEINLEHVLKLVLAMKRGQPVGTPNRPVWLLKYGREELAVIDGTHRCVASVLSSVVLSADAWDYASFASTALKQHYSVRLEEAYAKRQEGFTIETLLRMPDTVRQVTRLRAALLAGMLDVEDAKIVRPGLQAYDEYVSAHNLFTVPSRA